MTEPVLCLWSRPLVRDPRPTRCTDEVAGADYRLDNDGRLLGGMGTVFCIDHYWAFRDLQFDQRYRGLDLGSLSTRPRRKSAFS